MATDPGYLTYPRDPVFHDRIHRIFDDEVSAREWLEERMWPDGPVCPHCGNGDTITELTGTAHRDGLYQCGECRKQFTVKVKTVFEGSPLEIRQWLTALYFLTTSKYPVPVRFIQAELGISYKASWFVIRRLREAMRQGGLPNPHAQVRKRKTRK